MMTPQPPGIPGTADKIRALADARGRDEIAMISFLWIGTGLGALFGLLHGIYVFRQQISATGSRAAGLYYGFWTFALWLLFGAYALAFWVAGAIAYAISAIRRRRGSTALAGG